jgi:hypothetical protein
MRSEPGGSRLPNGWGLFDMLGNAWEVTLDRMILGEPSLEIDTEGTTFRLMRISTRGGGFGGGSFYSRSALNRQMDQGVDAPLNPTCGFRIVCRNKDQNRPDRRLMEDFLQQLQRSRDQSTLSPENPDAVMTEWAIAETLVKLDRGEEALKCIDDCVCQVMGKMAPLWYSRLILLRLNYCQSTKDAAGCRRSAEIWEKMKDTRANSFYNAARLRSITASVIRITEKSPLSNSQANSEADRAMGWLQQAIAAGFKDVEIMKLDTDLDALREREDFKKLIADLEGKKKN